MRIANDGDGRCLLYCLLRGSAASCTEEEADRLRQDMVPCLYYFKTEEEWRRVVPSYVFESGQHGHEITRDRYAERFLSSSTAELPSSAIILWQRLRSPTSSVFVLPYNLSTGNSERVEFFESVEEERGVLIIERTWTPEHGTGHYELVRRLRGGKRSFFSPDDEVVRSLRNTVEEAHLQDRVTHRRSKRKLPAADIEEKEEVEEVTDIGGKEEKEEVADIEEKEEVEEVKDIGGKEEKEEVADIGGKEEKEEVADIEEKEEVEEVKDIGGKEEKEEVADIGGKEVVEEVTDEEDKPFASKYLPSNKPLQPATTAANDLEPSIEVDNLPLCVVNKVKYRVLYTNGKVGTSHDYRVLHTNDRIVMYNEEQVLALPDDLKRDIWTGSNDWSGVPSNRTAKMLRLYKLFTRPVPDTSKNKHVFREIVYHTTDESDEWIVVKWLGGEHTIELLDFFAEELNDQELLQTLLSMAVNDNDNEARIEAKALLRRRHWETYPNADTQQQARRSTRNHSSSRAEPFSGVSRVKRQRTTPTSILPHRIHVSSIPALFRCSRCTLKSPGPQPIAGIFVCSHCLRDNCGETVYIKRYGRPRLTPVRVVVRSSDDAFVREAELLARNDSVTSGSFNKADIIVIEYHHDGKTAEQHIQYINEAIRQSTRKEPDIVLVLSCWENNVEQNRAMQTLASQHRSTIFVTFHESVPPRECFSQSHEFLSDTIAYSNVRFLSFFVALCERRHKCVLYVDLNHPSGPGPFRVIKRVSGKSNVCVLCGKTYPKMGGSLGGRKWVSGTGLRMLRCPVCCVDALVVDENLNKLEEGLSVGL